MVGEDAGERRGRDGRASGRARRQLEAQLGEARLWTQGTEAERRGGPRRRDEGVGGDERRVEHALQRVAHGRAPRRVEAVRGEGALDALVERRALGEVVVLEHRVEEDARGGAGRERGERHHVAAPSASAGRARRRTRVAERLGHVGVDRRIVGV
jgi:hypothetical protein